MAAKAAPRWTAPPRPDRADGARRRLGVEIEFAGVSVADAAELVRARFGGEIAYETPHRANIAGTAFGDFRVELDMHYAHAPAKSDAARFVRDAVADLSSAVVPVEIVCPPIAWDEAHALDDLRADLQRLGAAGTREGLFYAFGAQLNVEPPGLEVADLLPALQSFVLLRDWLRREIGVDRLRSIWFFETPFPDGYCARVLDPTYAPDQTAMIDDYLRANPTRDRELDCLPLWAHLDAKRVRRALPDEKINPRPTWHYRLPNSEVDAADWSIGLEWSRWAKVERLAADPEMLRKAADAWLANRARVFPRDWLTESAALAARL